MTKYTVTKTTTITKTIDHCYRSCPYWSADNENMVCGHSYWDDKAKADPYVRMIISHPECDTGFPDLCPLRFWKNGD